jgi:hypothetical protein
MGINASSNKKTHKQTHEASSSSSHHRQFADVGGNSRQQLNKQSNTAIPTVIRYNGAVARTVRITGSFTNWDEHGIPLTKSGDEFYVILNLQKGEHEFRFVVDGKFTVDTTQPTMALPQGVANVVTVTDDSILGSIDLDDPTRIFKSGNVVADDSFGQEEVVFEESRKLPPLCPPHLRYTPLNSYPQKRVFCDVPPAASKVFMPYPPSGDPCVLPMPLHVTVNHVYFQRREGYCLLGTTSRYKAKYCTVVLYKPESSSNGATCNVTTTSVPVPSQNRM